MTALSSEDQRLRGEQLGADRYLVKSQVGIEDVVRTVHEVLADAPVSQPSAQQFFSQPAPSAVARPAAPASVPPRPQPPAEPAPSFQQPAPAPAAAPAPIEPSVAMPAPQQQAPIAPAPAFQQPTPAPSGLPQPTAPFSSQRPANLADRIIHPLESTVAPGPDVSALIDNELNSISTPQIPTPPQPPAPQASPFDTPQQPQQPPQQSRAIPYEETPRDNPPQGPNPFGGAAA